MDLRNSGSIKLRNFYFTTVQKLFFRKFSSKVDKCIIWNSIRVLPNQVSKNASMLSSKCLKILSLMQSYIRNRAKLSEQIEFKG